MRLREGTVAAPLVLLREPEKGRFELVIGDGKHGCVVYAINRGQVAWLAIQSTAMALRIG